MRTVGILGGTFDPPHNGHLRVAIEVCERLALDEVRLIPCHTPPHRSTPIASPEQRMQMVELATREASGISVDSCEIQRGGTSYTIDTLRALHAQIPETQLILILGDDAFAALPTWRSWESIFDYAHIVVASRGGEDRACSSWCDPLRRCYEMRRVDAPMSLKSRVNGSILMMALPLLEISSSVLRHKLAHGASITALVPSAVLAENVACYERK